MSHFVAIILGFVEGLTEFIPISSSGHLIIARQILGANNLGGLSFDAILQLSTSCALLVYFWKDVWHLTKTFLRLISKKPVEPRDKTLLYSIIIGTIPAVILGLLLEKKMDTIFRNIHLVALALLAGSALMWYAQKKFKENREHNLEQNKELDLWKGIKIGFFQCLALIPGVSRSGATISGGYIVGLSREEAVRYSFLLSLPVLFGSGLKKLFEVRHELFTSTYGSSLVLGSVVAFITGLAAISFLIKYLKKHNLDLFIWYRVALSIAILLLF